MKPQAPQLLEDRADDGIFAVSRDVYLDPELFQLELEHIFEGGWLYLCHESQLPEPGDFFTTHMGRQPVVLVRGDDGGIRGFVNACAHRGAKLCRTRRGHTRFMVCPYHGWVYNLRGENVEIKDRHSGGYPAQFDQQSHDLTPLGQLESYRGFVFGSLKQDVGTLDHHLGAATAMLDLMVDQSPQGLEILRGSSTYTFEGNWKLQAENGVDGYHVGSVHGNYLAMVMRRIQSGNDKVKSIAAGDLSKMPSGAWDLGRGHTMIWGDVPMVDSRPLNQSRAEIEQRAGTTAAHWMINRSRNVGLFPNVFVMDQTSTQIRVFRPLSVDRTEVTIYGIAPKGEPAAARYHRIRQYEDFFNASGMATPDDLSEFEACQNGNRGLRDELQYLDRGLHRVVRGADDQARQLGVEPASCGQDWADETLFHGFYRRWLEDIGGG